MNKLTLFIGFGLLAVVAAEPKSYENYKLISVDLRDEEDAAVLKQLEEDGADLWTPLIAGAAASFLIPPEMEDSVFEQLSLRQMSYRIANRNIGEIINEERRLNERAQRDSRIVGTFARYAAIESWLKSAAESCGNNCVLETIGKSFEGRNLYAFRFGKNIKSGAVLPRIFTESSLHAREWLAQASHIYIIDQLIKQFGKDSSITNAFSKYEIDFVVAANPDGYEYAQTSDRLWRKTRSQRSGTRCIGVDPNRNFDVEFCGEGTSKNACSDIYCGPAAFSEPETAAVSNFLNKIKNTTKGYIAQHTYCQMILIPHGYTSNVLPQDFNELQRVAKAMADAIKAKSGKVYTYGNSASLLYPAAGASDDWAKLSAKIKYSYTIELRPTCNAQNGFVVNPSEIAPAGTELLAALVAMTSNMQ